MKKENNHILSYCSLSEKGILLNANNLLTFDEKKPFNELSKEIYKQLRLEYPKFYKMDPLSKLAFLAASVLIENNTSDIDENTALILANKSSCIDVDRQHINSIKDDDHFYPSPATFVYTLPNIAIGEISIRYQLKSENSFFIFDRFPSQFFADYSNHLIDEGISKNVICGWVEKNKETFEAFIYIVDPKGSTTNNAQNILNCYNK